MAYRKEVTLYDGQEVLDVENSWLCPICEAEWETQSEAEQCQSQGEAEPAYSVGDRVFVRNWQDTLVPTEITKVVREHEAFYYCDPLVIIGRGWRVGREPRWDGDDERLLKESDIESPDNGEFERAMYKVGDRILVRSHPGKPWHTTITGLHPGDPISYSCNPLVILPSGVKLGREAEQGERLLLESDIISLEPTNEPI